MADRETKTITTPGGHTVILRAYLTGREANQLKELLFADLKLNVEDVKQEKMAIDNIPGSLLVKQEEKCIELLVVSVDGIADLPAQLVLDLPSVDYEAVVEAVSEIRNPTTPTE